jgi:hypothetical protein
MPLSFCLLMNHLVGSLSHPNSVSKKTLYQRSLTYAARDPRTRACQLLPGSLGKV